MDKVGPPLGTRRHMQRLYESNAKSDSAIRRHELLPIYKQVCITQFGYCFSAISLKGLYNEIL